MTGLPLRQAVSPEGRPELNREELKEVSKRAYGVTVRHYALLFEAIRKDKGLTEEQRAAALYSLKLQQRTEAATARRKARDDEKERQRPERKNFKPHSLKHH